MLDIEDPFAGNFGAHGDGRGVGIELEVGNGVRVRGEEDLATRINGKAGKIGVEILAAGKSVDFDRDAGVGAVRKHGFPPRLEPRAVVEVTTTGVGEDVHLRSVNGAQQPIGLITVGIELTVDGGDHAVDLETFAPGHIESAVGQDLDFETLEEPMIFAVPVIPSFDPPALEADPFPVEPRRDLEASRVVGDHRPGIAASTARPRHGLERRLAVGMAGVPMTGAAQPLGMEIRGAGAKTLGHLSPAEIALACGTATRDLAALETLDSGLQRVFTSAGYKLRNQRSKPVRCVSQELSTRSPRRVEGGVTGSQQRQSPVAGRFGIRECEQGLGQRAVGGRRGSLGSVPHHGLNRMTVKHLGRRDQTLFGDEGFSRPSRSARILSP